MKTFLILLLLNIGGGVQATSASGVCPPAPYTREQLLDLKQSGFQIEDDSERNALAVALMACVGATDPEIRDGIVFEGTAGPFSGWVERTADCSGLWN